MKIAAVKMKHIVILLVIIVGTSLGVPHHGRVVNGTTASPGQFPFVVYLGCGGTIINKNWILTTANCVDSLSKIESTALVGTNDVFSGGVWYNISQYVKHEGYDPDTKCGTKHNIGLLKIDGEFEFTDLVQPVEFIDPEENSTCTFAGWGQDEMYYFPYKLLFAEMTSISYEVCRNIVGDELRESYWGPEQMCGVGGEGKRAFFYDNGGPLVCNGKLAGVLTDVGVECGVNYPDIYVRPTAYIDWINEKIQS